MQTYWACPMDGTRMAEACFARWGTSRLELGYMVRDEEELVQWQGGRIDPPEYNLGALVFRCLDRNANLSY